MSTRSIPATGPWLIALLLAVAPAIAQEAPPAAPEPPAVDELQRQIDELTRQLQAVQQQLEALQAQQEAQLERAEAEHMRQAAAAEAAREAPAEALDTSTEFSRLNPLRKLKKESKPEVAAPCSANPQTS